MTDKDITYIAIITVLSIVFTLLCNFAYIDGYKDGSTGNDSVVTIDSITR